MQIEQFLQTTPYKDFKLEVASADASFRSYYRLTKDDESYILMDASLEKESLHPFLLVSQKLLDVDVKAPKIFHQDLEYGYLILEDFGDTNLLDLLNEENFESFYKKAIDEIIKMQGADTTQLPLYDKEFLHFEMDLMQEWYLEKKLSLNLSRENKQMLKQALERISEIVLSQPQESFVHRDFHSRNIMVKADGSLGIIDYQDGMSGAITYDLVSLLKDCYISFEREKVEQLVLYFRDRLGLEVEDEEFLKWFDFMGLQRHIKVLGIFSRLHLRDNKEGYLKDIPLTLSYVLETASRYDETKELAAFLKSFA
ncbi:aminoglycoside phosphotransferase family protein [Sulfurimonas marina]|uniref:Aminoglycoside phosphotransferase n=1 Tax=Sulfurimonas marina TaxID=2590551 RepID=A0A7M1AXL7_9BACT|nr:phosphotransferase [Sulfurimonas marina]QOP42193.1 aminoglycoside phosphotransferase [Sulfurimonas marina]